MKSFTQFITEGNPLARLKTHIDSGRHFSVMSAERSGLTPIENAVRHHELKHMLSNKGYGFKEAEGHWEGGKEKSIVVFAKDKGHEAGEALRGDINGLGEHFGQDSVFHHNTEHGYLFGTNESGFPGYHQTSDPENLHYNRPDRDFQTELKPNKRNSARFTTIPDGE